MSTFVEECQSVVRASFGLHATVDEHGCHVWHGSLTKDGYGSVKVRKRSMLAHRVAKIAARGEDIPWRMQVDHLCGVKACVNPSHLEVVTQTENVRRGREFKTHCPNGHEYTAENLRGATASLGHRGCRQCDVDRNALIAFAAEALGISGAEFKRRYGQSRGAAVLAIDSAAIAGRLALVICEQERLLAWHWKYAGVFKAERDAARAEVAALQVLVQDTSDAFTSGRREVLADLRAKVEGLEHDPLCWSQGGSASRYCDCPIRDVLALFDEEARR